MKRSIMVLSLSALAAVGAQAQTAGSGSSVTLYGAIDAYVGRQDAGGGVGHRHVLNSGFNPNALGFAGSEDLGGGLRAGFTLEGQPVLDTGTFAQGGKFFGRQSNLYLAGLWGRATAGRIHTAGRAFGIKYTATGWLTTDPMGNLQFAMGSGISPAMNADAVGARASNAISYASPTFGGFSFSLLQSAAEGGQFSAGSAKVTVVGLSYAAGPFSADFVYNRIPDIAGSQIRQDDYALGATYDARVVKFLAAMQVKKGWAVATPGALTPIAGSEATDRFVVVGAQVPLGTSSVVAASVGRMWVADVHKGQRGANISAPFSNVLDNVTAWSLAYTYSLSKRTQLFAAYGRLTNTGAGNASITADLRPTGGNASSLLASGIRHSF